MRRSCQLLAKILVLAALGACAGTQSQTSVDRVTRATELPNAPYSNLVIVAITERGATAREFEEVLAKELTKKGVVAIGYHRAAERADVNEEVLRRIAESQRADAILMVTARLVSAQREFREERTGVQAEVRRGGLVDFFRYDYDEYRTPASTAYRVNVQFNTDMFDVATEERVYTVESHTDFAETTSEIINDESRAIARRLRKDKMVR